MAQTKIHWITEITIGDGKLDAFKELAAGIIAAVEATELDTLAYEWRFYPEAGSYSGQIDIDNSDRMTTSFVVPEDASDKTFHVLLLLTDNGSPALTRYRRLVVRCE